MNSSKARWAVACAALAAALGVALVMVHAANASEILIGDAKSQPESLTAAPGGVLIVGSASSPFVYRVKPGSTAAEKFIDASSDMGPDFAFIGYQRGSAFVDMNNDGFMDLVVTSLAEKPRILVNNALNGNNWILFDLRGRKSNREGIGARVKVTTGSGRTLYNLATTSVGFMSSSDRRVHFGLGKEQSIEAVEIRWPGGAVQVLDHVKPNQILKVEEPDVKKP